MGNELFEVEKGKGAYCNGSTIKISNRTSLQNSVICLGTSSRGSTLDLVNPLSKILENRCGIKLLGSAALSLAYLAAGRFEGYWERHLFSWDCLAGLLLIEEAGGWAIDFLDNKDWKDGGLVMAGVPALNFFFSHF